MKLMNLDLNDTKWDDFCYDSDDCWYWHTTDWMEYTLEYMGGESEQLSFYIDDGKGEILAICPLIKEDDKLSFSKSFGPNPALRNGLSDKVSKSIYKKIFSKINQIALERNIEECIMSISTLAKNNLSKFTYNYLMKYGFENISLNTQVLDLEKDEKDLWGEIKKSHRYEIRKGTDQLEFIVNPPFSEDREKFNQLKELHFLAAGRKTRSDKSWDLQYDAKLKGNAVIIIAYLDDIPVGGSYTYLYKNGAYYGVSANHPDYESISISHPIQWETIKWLKRNRYRYYELGYQHLSDQPYDHPSQKDISISKFKRHFGGYTLTHYRGIKNYRKNT